MVVGDRVQSCVPAAAWSAVAGAGGMRRLVLGQSLSRNENTQRVHQQTIDQLLLHQGNDSIIQSFNMNNTISASCSVNHKPKKDFLGCSRDPCLCCCAGPAQVLLTGQSLFTWTNLSSRPLHTYMTTPAHQNATPASFQGLVSELLMSTIWICDAFQSLDTIRAGTVEPAISQLLRGHDSELKWGGEPGWELWRGICAPGCCCCGVARCIGRGAAMPPAPEAARGSLGRPVAAALLGSLAMSGPTVRHSNHQPECFVWNSLTPDAARNQLCESAFKISVGQYIWCHALL